VALPDWLRSKSNAALHSIARHGRNFMPRAVDDFCPLALHRKMIRRGFIDVFARHDPRPLLFHPARIKRLRLRVVPFRAAVVEYYPVLRDCFHAPQSARPATECKTYFRKVCGNSACNGWRGWQGEGMNSNISAVLSAKFQAALASGASTRDAFNQVFGSAISFDQFVSDLYDSLRAAK
jgi:hypothetical protein